MAKIEHVYEHIEVLTEEFNAIGSKDLGMTSGEYWMSRMLLAIAQQLSVISASLKKDRE